jgi:hypothetical protein
MSVAPQAVIVTRPTEYELLLAHHGTRGQVEFFLAERGQGLGELERRHEAQRLALRLVGRAIPATWRRSVLDRDDLARWIFEPNQIVIAVGQDGLVANVAKYLDGQPVIGINPEPDRNPGVLVRNSATTLAGIIDGLAHENPAIPIERRRLVEVRIDDGQHLRALNELYLGHSSHQSARYEITEPGGRSETQSSSGLLIGTGTGSTGWCRSVWREREVDWPLPIPTSPDLAWFVREAWPSPATGVDLTSGLLRDGEALTVRSERDGLVIFGDGIEGDHLALGWGQAATISVAKAALHLI